MNIAVSDKPLKCKYRRCRAGFTLLEIMLVLAVLAVVAAVSWPSFDAWFQSQKLDQGRDAVRTHWVKARTLAMDEGRPYRFAWSVGAGQYRLAPDHLEYWGDQANSAVPPQSTGTSFAPGKLVEESLPDGVVFAGGGQAGGWTTETVLFWPDGTAKIYGPEGLERPEIIVVFTDPRKQIRALKLRALTGVVTSVNMQGP